MSILRLLRRAAPAAVALSLVAGCDSDDPAEPEPEVEFTDRSSTVALAKAGPQAPSGLEIYTLISSSDDLAGSPGFTFGGSADGAGLLKNDDGTFTYVVNHEDNFAVSRVTFDATMAPRTGEYILTSDAGMWRLCSATLCTPRTHGFGPVYITTGESGPESQIHRLDPYAPANTSQIVQAFGAWSTENAVPLPQSAFAGKTVVLIGDDDSSQYGGQVALYVADGVGNFEDGSLYVLARTNGNVRERDMVVGQSYPVEFRKIEDHRSLAPTEFNPAAQALGAMPFGRVEDLDYAKDGAGRAVYFNVTGQADSGANADYSRTKYGRTYRLTLDAADPTRGRLEVLLDGDDRDGPAGQFQNPDNILVTENYVYVQEDPNGYGDETHHAYIYQYDIRTGAVAVVMEIDRRTEPEFNRGSDGTSPTEPRFGDWEYGALLDVSDVVGVPDTFVLNVQPHTWRSPAFAGVDGGSLRANENQGSQTLLIRGLPR